MCLAIPGKIIEIYNPDDTGIKAKASFGGVIKEIYTDWLPDLKPGEYVMVHAGFAISRVDEKEAEETIKSILEAEEQIIKEMKK